MIVAAGVDVLCEGYRCGQFQKMAAGEGGYVRVEGGDRVRERVASVLDAALN